MVTGIRRPAAIVFNPTVDSSENIQMLRVNLSKFAMKRMHDQDHAWIDRFLDC